MVLDTEFMESALLMPSQKLTPTFCMEDMDSQPSLFSLSVTSFSVLDIIFG